MLRQFLFGLFFCLLTPAFGQCESTTSNWGFFKSNTPYLLNKAYALEGSFFTQTGVKTCGADCFNEISAIEKRNFSFVEPLLYTNSPTEFLRVLEQNTECEDLGVLSLVDMVSDNGTSGPAEAEYDFFRPTRGFAIYLLPPKSGGIIMVSAQDYVDTGLAAKDRSKRDEHVEPKDMPKPSAVVTESIEQGIAYLIAAKSCTVVGPSYNIMKSIRYTSNSPNAGAYDNDRWFANPIMLKNKLFFLNVWESFAFPNLVGSHDQFYLDVKSLSVSSSHECLFSTK